MTRAAIFLDRDGTLNVDKGYVHRIEQWEWIPGAISAIAALKKTGFLMIVVTNQAGIARGYYTTSDMAKLHSTINTELKQHEAMIDGFYHCPHHPEYGEMLECECRKPMPGLIEQAKRDFDIDLRRSWLVGDKVSDVQSGISVGVKSLLVLTGYGTEESTLLSAQGICVADIAEACDYIISRS